MTEKKLSVREKVENSSSFLRQKKRHNFFPSEGVRVNQPNDKFEQETDAIADKVMRMPINANSFFKPSSKVIQRKCAHCEAEEKNLHLGQSIENAVPNMTTFEDQTLHSSGQKLDDSTRSFMEERFGYDFGNVQIHNDSLAHQSSLQINALAYTRGNHIAFAKNQYQPNTFSGRRLLAHELTHVVQQNNSVSRLIQRKCTDKSVRSSMWVSVKNEYDFTAVDGYTPLSGGIILDVFFDGKNYFFCYKDKRIYLKYSDSGDGVMQDFEKMYGIRVENGGDKWQHKELVVVAEALSMLSPAEVANLHGYRFIKEGGVRIDDGDKVTAGLTTQDIIHNEYTIQFWKFCFDGSSDTEVSHSGVPEGVPCVLHEIGHALMYSRQRPLVEAMYFEHEYQKKYEKASLQKHKAMKVKLDELIAAEDKAEKENSKKPTVEAEFLKLTKGKKALTSYSKKNENEAFAEAFAIYKINPKLLKKKNPKLYEYFLHSGYQ